MNRPNGYAELIKTFGNLNDYLDIKGRPTKLWDNMMTQVKFPEPLPSAWMSDVTITRCTVHKLIAPIVEKVLKEIHSKGLWPKLIDFGGGYYVRPKRSSGNEYSTHSWGIALDFNVKNNQMGMRPEMDMRIVDVFEKAGFVWGGRWKKPDGMHFQYCDNY